MAFKSLTTELVFGGIGVEVDIQELALIHASAIEECGEHDVVVNDDVSWVVGYSITPLHKLVTVGGNGGKGCRTAFDICACADDKTLVFIIIDGHGIGLYRIDVE